MQAELTATGVQLKTSAGFPVWMTANDALALYVWMLEHRDALVDRVRDAQMREYSLSALPQTESMKGTDEL